MPDHPTRDDIDLCSGAFWAGDHHEALTWMRREAPVYFDGNVWGVTRYADVKDVSRQPEVFSNAGGIRPNQGPLPMMIDMDDPAHLQAAQARQQGLHPPPGARQRAAGAAGVHRDPRRGDRPRAVPTSSTTSPLRCR